MDIPTREQLERRMHALVADHLDQIAEANPDGFDLGVVAISAEVVTPDPEATLLRREDGGYTPAIDSYYYWSYYCSDHRWWVKKALYAEANDHFQYPPTDEEDEENDDPEE